MRAVQRILAVFESFTPERPTLQLQEIARCIGLAKSTTFRIVQSLDKMGYLVRLDDQKYCLSFRLIRLAGLVQSTLDIRTIARPIMKNLARQTNEAVTLNILDKRDRVCIEAVNTPSVLMTVTKPGEHRRLLNGATAKVLMAYMRKEEQAKAIAYVVKTSGPKYPELLEELRRIRRQGFAATHGERVLGVTAISAPIRDVNSEAKYCITIVGPTVRMKSKEKDFGKLVILAANNISMYLGGEEKKKPMRKEQ